VRTLPPDARRPATATTSGILRPDEFAARVQLSRPPAGAAVEPWVEHYWTVRWDLTDGEPYCSELVPHPALNITVESGTTPHHGLEMPAVLLTGVTTRRFQFTATGEGRVFGVKFRPGGFGALAGEDVSRWTDRICPLAAVLGAVAADRILHDVLAEPDDADRAAVMDAALAARAPDPDPRYEQVLAIVAELIADPSLTSVDAVCRRFALTPRTLQRLFHRYVGVGPKWVLRRYRLHDAVTLIDADHDVDLAELAANLGWFDQAHFTREFTEQVGVSPRAYAMRRR
jgi:AraC-like DNA-binding protein